MLPNTLVLFRQSQMAWRRAPEFAPKVMIVVFPLATEYATVTWKGKLIDALFSDMLVPRTLRDSNVIRSAGCTLTQMGATWCGLAATTNFTFAFPDKHLSSSRQQTAVFRN